MIYNINLGDAVKGTPYFSNATEATIGLVPNPKWWVKWPLMPVKSTRLAFPNNLGYLMVPDYRDTWEGPYAVYASNVFAPSPDDPIIATYATLDAFLRAGWIVD